MVAAVAAVLPFSAGASAGAAANLLRNGGFDRTTSGWDGYASRLSLAADGVGGGTAAKVDALPGATSFSIDTSPFPVAATAAGTGYSASGWYRSDRSLEVCLRVREWRAGAVVGSAQACGRSSTAWQPFGAVHYAAASGGDQLDLYVYALDPSPGDSFEVDELALTPDQPAPAAASPAPAPAAAPAAAAAPGGCTVYASPAGSDAASGTAALPVRSLQRVVDMLRPGGVGCLLPGTYAGGATVAAGGDPGAPITIRSAASTRALIHGKIWIEHSAHDVVLSNLALDDVVPIDRSQMPPISDLLIEGDRVTVADSDIQSENTGICVLVGGNRGTASDTTITGSRIHNCGPLPAYNHGHGIYVEHSRNLRVLDNWIYDNADRGIQLYPDAQHTLIQGNVIDGNGEGIIISGDGNLTSNDNLVTGNIISNSRLRYNVESYWSSAVGVGNVVRGNCLWNGAEGNIGEQTGFTATDNKIMAPPSSASGRDLRQLAATTCAAATAQS